MGRPPPTNFGVIKLESLGYRMVKKIAENVNRLSTAHQRHRQTDDRRQTDGSAIAYSERERLRLSHGYPDGAAFVITVSLDYRRTYACFYSLMCYAWSVDG